jgi:hypothetical protein
MGIGRLSQSRMTTREPACVARCLGHVLFIAMPVRSLVCTARRISPAARRGTRMQTGRRSVVAKHRHVMHVLSQALSCGQKNFQLKLSFGRKDVFDATHQYVFYSNPHLDA